MSFSFSFSGDDIEEEAGNQLVKEVFKKEDSKPAASAFPVQGKPQLPPTQHDLAQMLSQLPSKIAYSFLDVELEDGSAMSLPRRELWDVRVQLMAEDDGSGSVTEGLGSHDVKTGVYEGGFKSWESSLDLVQVLATEPFAVRDRASHVIELGCGTALPSLSIFQRTLSGRKDAEPALPLFMTVADYNPTVLQLVTLPNFLLAWAFARKDDPALKDAFSMEGELELMDEVKEAFQKTLADADISISWLSGGWCPEFVELLYAADGLDFTAPLDTLILGAETIYSPFALNSFYETVMTIFRREQAERPNCEAQALVGAKRLYFGVGGSLDDFVTRAREGGMAVEQLKEEAVGVRRGVIHCKLPS